MLERFEAHLTQLSYPKVNRSVFFLARIRVASTLPGVARRKEGKKGFYLQKLNDRSPFREQSKG